MDDMDKRPSHDTMESAFGRLHDAIVDLLEALPITHLLRRWVDWLAHTLTHQE